MASRKGLQRTLPDFDACASPVARQLLVNYMRDLGLEEIPRASNKGPQILKYLEGFRKRYGDRYTRRGALWCALCTEYLAREAYEGLGVTPCPLDKWHGLGGSTGWLSYAAKAGALVQPADVRPGDVGIIHHPDDPETEADEGRGHVCVVGRRDGQIILSIDGNHNHRVEWAERPITAFAGFARLPFPA